MRVTLSNIDLHVENLSIIIRRTDDFCKDACKRSS